MNPTRRLTVLGVALVVFFLGALFALAAVAVTRITPLLVGDVPALVTTLALPAPTRATIALRATATATQTSTPTLTPTTAPTSTATQANTSTHSPTLTPTRMSTARPTRTNTPLPPASATSRPATTAAPTGSPTITSPPPTATASPTQTNTAPPAPTATLIPPSANAFWGVNGGPIDGGDSPFPFDGNLSRNAPLRAKSFYWMAKAGLNWFRNYSSDGIDYSWRFVEPVQGQYNWATWDTLATEAQRQSVSLLAEIGNSVPAWANSSSNWRDKPLDLYAEPMETSSWYRYVRAMVERYDGDGVDDMPGLTHPIKYWEIWNEPDLREGLNAPAYPAHQFNGSVTDIVRLLRVAYSAVKAADPGATVVGPAGSQSPGNASTGNWLIWNWQSFVDAGGLAYVDVVSFHRFYTGYDWDISGGLDALLNQVDATRGGKPVWITEMGWFGDPSANYLEKARSFVRSMAIIWARPFMGRYFWYSFHESETYETSYNHGFIQTLNGGAARGAEPDPLFHPVYQAAAVMTRVLAGFEAGDHPSELGVGAAARAFHLSKNGLDIWLAWQRAGDGSSQINLDTGGKTVRVIGLFGEDLGAFAGGALTVGPSPIYLTTRLDWNANVGRITGRLRDGARPNDWGNGVAGAVVQLTGPVSASATTDADGNYLFEALPEGNYTVSVLSYPAAPATWSVAVTRQGAWGRTSFAVTLPAALPSR